MTADILFEWREYQRNTGFYTSTESAALWVVMAKHCQAKLASASKSVYNMLELVSPKSVFNQSSGTYGSS